LSFDGALVDLPRPDIKSQANGRKDLSTDVAPGGKNKRLRGKPKGHGLRYRLPAPFAQKPHNSRGGLLDRAPRHINRRPIVLGA
jgi:hypothetical protein